MTRVERLEDNDKRMKRLSDSLSRWTPTRCITDWKTKRIELQCRNTVHGQIDGVDLHGTTIYLILIQIIPQSSHTSWCFTEIMFKSSFHCFATLPIVFLADCNLSFILIDFIPPHLRIHQSTSSLPSSAFLFVHLSVIPTKACKSLWIRL